MIQPIRRGWYIPATAAHPNPGKPEVRRQPGPPAEATIPKRAKKTRKTGDTTGQLTATRPDAKVRDYDAHVLVCKGGDCKKRGSKDFQKALKGELREAGINRDVRVDSVGCLGLCKHGPNAVVYPGGTWYLGLIEPDAREIIEGHLKNGEPVEHLSAQFRPRKKKRR